MKNVNVLLIASALIHLSTADLCSYNFSMSNIPNSLVGEVTEMIKGGVLNIPNYCEEIPYSEENIKYYLYTRNNPLTPIKLTVENTDILRGKKTIILSHGFLCSYKNDLMPELKNAYLERYDANVIIIDWSFYSANYYTECYCLLPKIAESVATMLCKADFDQNINIKRLHILGHSMGAQLAGLIGQNLKHVCQSLANRITGLDPAGPLYINAHEHERLDASDAKHVIVIHTNMGVLGYTGNCGTLDFYPNMGVNQHGCTIFHSPANNMVDKLAYPVVCSHLRAVSYMIESLTLNNFKGKSCLNCGGCVANPFSRYHATMGEDFKADRAPCGYYMKTNDKPPYGRGF